MFIQKNFYGYRASNNVQIVDQKTINNIIEIFNIKTVKTSLDIKKNTQKNNIEFSSTITSMNKSLLVLLYSFCLDYFLIQSITSSLNQLNIKSKNFKIEGNNLVELIKIFENFQINNLKLEKIDTISNKDLEKKILNIELNKNFNIQYLELSNNLQKLKSIDSIFVEVFELFLNNLVQLPIAKQKKNKQTINKMNNKFLQIKDIVTYYKFNEVSINGNKYLSFIGLVMVLESFKSKVNKSINQIATTDTLSLIEKSKSSVNILKEISSNQLAKMQQYNSIFKIMLNMQNNDKVNLNNMLKNLNTLYNTLIYFINNGILVPNNGSI